MIRLVRKNFHFFVFGTKKSEILSAFQRCFAIFETTNDSLKIINFDIFSRSAEIHPGDGILWRQNSSQAHKNVRTVITVIINREKNLF